MYLFVDTETTGLPGRWDAPWDDVGNWPRMVELAYLLCDEGGRVIDGMSTLIIPGGFAVPAEATSIHGITTEKAGENGIPVRQALEQFLAARTQAGYLVAHNIDYDVAVLAAELVRSGLPLSPMTIPMICTMKQSATFCRIPGRYGQYKWPSLSELHSHLFGHRPDQAHRGKDDVMTCAKCFFALKERGVI
jgi:DNA polymerase III epsilon subunit-like protein